MIEYRTCPSNENFLSYLQTLWKENWIYCGEKWDKLIFYRPIKKEVKSRSLVTEWNKSISYLKKQREQIDSWEPIHIPDFITNESEWIKFISYWTQKNNDSWKMHCEKQKTFEIRLRWNTWHKDKKEIKSNTIW